MAKITIRNNPMLSDRYSLGSTRVLEKYAERVWRSKFPKMIHIIAKSGTPEFARIMQTLNIRRHHNGCIVEIEFDEDETRQYFGEHVIIQ